MQPPCGKYGLTLTDNGEISAPYETVPNPQSREVWRISTRRDRNRRFSQMAQSTALRKNPAIPRHSERGYWQRRILEPRQVAEQRGLASNLLLFLDTLLSLQTCKRLWCRKAIICRSRRSELASSSASRRVSPARDRSRPFCLPSSLNEPLRLP